MKFLMHSKVLVVAIVMAIPFFSTAQKVTPLIPAIFNENHPAEVIKVYVKDISNGVVPKAELHAILNIDCGRAKPENIVVIDLTSSARNVKKVVAVVGKPNGKNNGNDNCLVDVVVGNYIVTDGPDQLNANINGVTVQN